MTPIAPPRAGPAACPLRATRDRMRGLGLRPTHQRVMLAWLLFGTGDRHVSAEQLHEEARRARIPVSLATVYNTLHLFAREGLVREIAGVGARSWFDTKTGEHAHFLDEETGELVDAEGALTLGILTEAPAGYEIAGCDVILRVRRAR